MSTVVVAGATISSGVVQGGSAADGASRPPVKLELEPDARSVTAFEDVGFTITVSNPADLTARHVQLIDDLPAGGNLSWGLDDATGIEGCTISGEVYQQSLTCPVVDLPPQASYSVHLTSHTTTSTDDVIVNQATVTTVNSGTATRRIEIAHGTMRNECLSTDVDANRTVLFDDEFTEPELDPTKWTRDELPFRGQSGSTHKHNTQYGSYILPENTVVRDGRLELRTNDVPVTDPDVPALGTVPYTEGMIHTKGKFSTVGGYFEMCAKMPQGKGLWPAFWVVPESGAWPPEMDIVEWFGSVEAVQVGQPTAYGSNAGGKWQGTWQYSAEPTLGFHSYGMWWDPFSNPAKIRYYIDGQMVKEVSGTTSDLVSNTPMYMILNSGTWAPASRGGPPDETTVFPNAMAVDWVRVYNAPPPQPPYSGP